MNIKIIYVMGIILIMLSPTIFAVNLEQIMDTNEKLIRQKKYNKLEKRMKEILNRENIEGAKEIYEDAVITLIQQYDYEKSTKN